jgi:hypothetical protein
MTKKPWQNWLFLSLSFVLAFLVIALGLLAIRSIVPFWFFLLCAFFFLALRLILSRFLLGALGANKKILPFFSCGLFVPSLLELIVLEINLFPSENGDPFLWWEGWLLLYFFLSFLANYGSLIQLWAYEKGQPIVYCLPKNVVPLQNLLGDKALVIGHFGLSNAASFFYPSYLLAFALLKLFSWKKPSRHYYPDCASYLGALATRQASLFVFIGQPKEGGKS